MEETDEKGEHKMNKNIWLHWVGEKYYSINSFKKEVQAMGVCRRINSKILKNFNWGDKVYLATGIKDNGTKRTVIFGYFNIDCIFGVDISNMPDHLKNKVKQVSSDLFVDKRGCGVVVSGGFYISEGIKISDIAQYVKKDVAVKGENGTVFFDEPIELVLSNATLKTGFRGFKKIDDGWFFEKKIELKELIILN